MLFTFPSWYLFTIDLKKYLALGHSRPCFPRDFTSPAVLKIYCRRAITLFAYRAITVSGGAFQLASAKEVIFRILCPTVVWAVNAISCDTA